MINSVISAISNSYLLPLGSTVTDSELLPVKYFSRILKNLSHSELKSMISYSLSEGHPELRRQIALRTVGVLKGITPEDIIITNGCMEAVALAMLAVARQGDTIAIETPTNFGFLQLLQELGLLVMEVPIFAPITMGTAHSSGSGGGWPSTTGAPTKPTTVLVVTEELCTSTVASTPTARPANGFCSPLKS